MVVVEVAIAKKDLAVGCRDAAAVAAYLKNVDNVAGFPAKAGMYDSTHGIQLLFYHCRHMEEAETVVRLLREAGYKVNVTESGG